MYSSAFSVHGSWFSIIPLHLPLRYTSSSINLHLSCIPLIPLPTLLLGFYVVVHVRPWLYYLLHLYPWFACLSSSARVLLFCSILSVTLSYNYLLASHCLPVHSCFLKLIISARIHLSPDLPFSILFAFFHSYATFTACFPTGFSVSSLHVTVPILWSHSYYSAFFFFFFFFPLLLLLFVIFSILQFSSFSLPHGSPLDVAMVSLPHLSHLYG